MIATFFDRDEVISLDSSSIRFLYTYMCDNIGGGRISSMTFIMW